MEVTPRLDGELPFVRYFCPITPAQFGERVCLGDLAFLYFLRMKKAGFGIRVVATNIAPNPVAAG